jgi:hypothetical protein
MNVTAVEGRRERGGGVRLTAHQPQLGFNRVVKTAGLCVAFLQRGREVRGVFTLCIVRLVA